MNEKYEIIIEENGEEIKRVGAKGFLLTVVKGKSIYTLAMANAMSGLEVALMINANEELVNEMWESFGVTRKERKTLCRIARRVEMAVEKGNEE